ncbi:TPA: CDP-glycerol glycerophosphotransferase family protein [Providencia alcalifaciens]
MKIDKIVKGILLLISYPIYPISFLFPRSKKKWLFGSFGKFNDNSRYLFEYCVKNEVTINAYWVSKNKNEYIYVRKLGFPTIYKYSLSGFFHLLTSKVYIYSSYVNNISFFTSGNAVLVNLWHGIPLKKIEFDISTPPLNEYFKDANWVMKALYPHHHKRETLLLCPGEYLYSTIFKSAFKKDKNNIIDANYPRISFIKEKIKQENKNINEKEFNITYTPTWRDNAPNFIESKLALLEEIDEIAERKGFRFNIKLHSNSIFNPDIFLKFKNIYVVDNKIDPIELLLNTDCLITDYSSIYFDFLFLNRPIIFFQYDKFDYLRNRELYNTQINNLPGKLCKNDAELIELLSANINTKEHENDRQKIIKLISSENNSDYIIHRVEKSLQ